MSYMTELLGHAGFAVQSAQDPRLTQSTEAGISAGTVKFASAMYRHVPSVSRRNGETLDW
jgi:hypothetical protein